MNTYQIIEKKRDGRILSNEEISFLIQKISNGGITDSQIGAWLMASFLNGMDEQETTNLVKAMVSSGTQQDFKGDPTVIDKHSTGGVGDKTSFLVGPLAAACGVKVPMIAGRGLGHTGGTIDKAESIPGFQTKFSPTEFSHLLGKNQMVLTAQTEDIAPADKKLYAIRNVTATVGSIPLITASIMSKKIAEGISGLVMDIKYGNGAFMPTLQQAQKLAQSMMRVGRDYGIKIMVFITDMNSPLGRAVGHSLEIRECIHVLKGSTGPQDLITLSLQLSGAMVFLAEKAPTLEQAQEQVKEALTSGAALEKFRQLVVAQGGDPRIIAQPDLLPVAKVQRQIKARSKGYIAGLETKMLGMMAIELGGGRKREMDSIDFSVGFEFAKKPGDPIDKGDVLFTIYHHESQKQLVDSLEDHFFADILKTSPTPLPPPPLIAQVLPEMPSAK